MQASLDLASALVKGGGQMACHQPQPIAIDLDFVMRIHGSNGIFHIHNRRDSRFNHQIGHTGCIGRANDVGAINHNLNMQTMIDQQHMSWCSRRALITRQLRPIGQSSFNPACQSNTQSALLNLIGYRLSM